MNWALICSCLQAWRLIEKKLQSWFDVLQKPIFNQVRCPKYQSFKAPERSMHCQRSGEIRGKSAKSGTSLTSLSQLAEKASLRPISLGKYTAKSIDLENETKNAKLDSFLVQTEPLAHNMPLCVEQKSTRTHTEITSYYGVKSMPGSRQVKSTGISL